MEQRRIEIDRLAFWTAAEWSSVRPERSATEAFGRSKSDWIDGSITCFRASINWAWLQWHLKPDFHLINDALTRVVTRAAETTVKWKVPKDASWPGFHDSLMMYCAVLSGNQSTMTLAATRIKPANVRKKGYQYDEAVAGILAYHILNERDKEKQQLDIFERFKPNRIDPWPSRSLATALVSRDFKSLNKAVAAGAQKHWSDENLGRKGRARPVIIAEDRRRILLDVRRKDPYRIWPYVEAIFAKLAILDGATVTYDDFWLPLDFLKGTSCPMTDEAKDASSKKKKTSGR